MTDVIIYQGIVFAWCIT